MIITDEYGRELTRGSKEQLIEFLESHVEKESINVEKTIIDLCTPFMEKYGLDTLETAMWGTYDKYESAGEECKFGVNYEANWEEWSVKYNIDFNDVDELEIYREFEKNIEPKIEELNYEIKSFYGDPSCVYKLYVINEDGKYKTSALYY